VDNTIRQDLPQRTTRIPHLRNRQGNRCRHSSLALCGVTVSRGLVFLEDKATHGTSRRTTKSAGSGPTWFWAPPKACPQRCFSKRVTGYHPDLEANDLQAHFERSRPRVVGPKRVVEFDAVKARDTPAPQSNVRLSRSEHSPSEAGTRMTTVNDQAVYVTGFRGTRAPDGLVIPLKQDRRDDVLTAPDHVEFACASPAGELGLSDLSWSPLPDAPRQLPFGRGVPKADDCTPC
jgi:hypothetical protein